MIPRHNILLVEDDDAMRAALVSQLAIQGEFDTTEATTGAAALESISARHFNIVLLDIGLPDMDGRDVCRLIRRKGIHVPVIMLTGMGSEAEVILGLVLLSI